MIGAPDGGVDSSDRRGCTFSCDLLLSSTSPNNNTHPLLNIEKNEARFACLPLVHLQGIEEHHRGVEFTLCHSYSLACKATLSIPPHYAGVLLDRTGSMGSCELVNF